jgi:hypothetical protein
MKCVFVMEPGSTGKGQKKSQNIPQDGWKLTDILLLTLNAEHLDARTD